MRVSRQQAKENRERVIDVAARLFREHGVDGIGVNDLMQAAGLTRGGFYGQFESKDDLVRLACGRALDQNLAYWHRLIGKAGPDALAALTRFYLSTAHADDRSGGCTLATLGIDAARGDPGLRDVVTAGVQRFIEHLTPLMASDADATARAKAMATLSTLVGALVLSRAVGDARLGKALRQAAQAAVTARDGKSG